MEERGDGDRSNLVPLPLPFAQAPAACLSPGISIGAFSETRCYPAPPRPLGAEAQPHGATQVPAPPGQTGASAARRWGPESWCQPVPAPPGLLGGFSLLGSQQHPGRRMGGTLEKDLGQPCVCGVSPLCQRLIETPHWGPLVGWHQALGLLHIENNLLLLPAGVAILLLCHFVFLPVPPVPWCPHSPRLSAVGWCQPRIQCSRMPINKGCLPCGM